MTNCFGKIIFGCDDSDITTIPKEHLLIVSSVISSAYNPIQYIHSRDAYSFRTLCTSKISGVGDVFFFRQTCKNVLFMSGLMIKVYEKEDISYSSRLLCSNFVKYCLNETPALMSLLPPSLLPKKIFRP